MQFHPMPVALLALAAVLPMVAGAQTVNDPGPAGSGRAIFIAKDRAAARVVSTVYQGQFSFVRIETREPGAALNEHPLAVDAATLRAALAAVTLDDAHKTVLLGDSELGELVPPLVQALAQATAEQDVSFAIAGRYGLTGPFASRSITTARVFRRDGHLQVIFGLVRNPFESQFRATGYLLPFDPGQRSEPVARSTHVEVAAGAGQSVRADWVALNLTPVAHTAAAVVAAPAASSAAASGAAEPMPSAARAQPAGDADTIATRAAERLKALNKLHDQGLISDAEYQEKRAQILREL